MPRTSRHNLWATCATEPSLYHVTNRGVNRQAIFLSLADRLAFLAALAYCCLTHGLRVHCYCLMDNHFHLLLEDPMGKLSACLGQMQTLYARHFLDSRGRRGDGHLYKDRFFSKQVASARYYDALVCYILLNPTRCASPLASSPEAYLWSSAALHLGDQTPGGFFARLLEGFGGIEAILEGMHALTRREFREYRRTRFYALVAGEWIDAHAARYGRTPAAMRDLLAEHLARAALEADSEQELQAAAACDSTAGTDLGRTSGTEAQAAVPLCVPRVTCRTQGAALAASASLIIAECEAELSAVGAGVTELASYLLWRFTSATRRQIADRLRAPADLAARSIERLRTGRRLDARFGQLLWRLEWRLHWRLPCAPWRA